MTHWCIYTATHSHMASRHIGECESIRSHLFLYCFEQYDTISHCIQSNDNFVIVQWGICIIVFEATDKWQRDQQIVSLFSKIHRYNWLSAHTFRTEANLRTRDEFEFNSYTFAAVIACEMGLFYVRMYASGSECIENISEWHESIAYSLH